MTHPGRRPGRRPSLTRDEVARAAIEEGVTSLTMPAVARRLGVSHSTLYRYVHDRDDLVLAALDLAVREFDWPPADLGWRDLLTAFADALWRFLRQHPGMAEALQCVPGLPATVVDLAHAYVPRLRAAGLAGRDAAVAVDFVADLTIGTEIAMRGMGKVFETPCGRRTLREIYRDEWAALADVDPAVLEEATSSGRGWLDEKLAMLLDGLATKLPEIPPDTVTDHAPADRATIVAAGRKLARRAGLDAVSPRAVAEEAGCTLTALCQEVGDRDALVGAMLDAVARDVVVPAPCTDPRAELVALALAVHDALLRDPWAVPALADPPVLDRVCAAFRAAGVPEDEVAVRGQVLWDHVFGAVLSAAPHRERVRRGVEILVAGLTSP